jgi:uncharacterized repeat protein (TIGR02543 family)
VSTPGAPANLTATQQAGWSSKIALSPFQGVQATNGQALFTSDTIYASWVTQNAGTDTTSVPFSTELYVDGVLQHTFESGIALAAGGTSSVLDYALGSLSAGTHTVQIVIDSTNGVVESTKTDNIVTQTVVVYAPLPSFTVKASAFPTQGGTVSGTGAYRAKSTPTLTATPNTGYVFKNWTQNGVVVSTGSSYTFTVGRNRTLVANFAKAKYPLTVTASPSGGGKFKLNPAPLTGGKYVYNTNVKITAVPKPGYTFQSWSGDATGSTTTINVTMDSPKSITGTFVPSP